MKEIKPNILMSALIMCLFSSVVAFAEVIVLKSGKSAEGKLIEKTDEYIKIDFLGVPLTYYFDDINSIDGDAVSAGGANASSPKLEQNFDNIESALELSGIRTQLRNSQSRFPGSDLYGYVLDYFRNHNQENNLIEVLKWLNSDLSKKIVKLEIEATAPQAREKAAAFFNSMDSILTYKTKVDLIKELDRATGSIDFQVEFLTVSYKAYLEAINNSLSPEDRLKAEESEKAVIDKIGKAKGEIGASLLKFMIYIYHPLTDEELKEYISFMKSGPAQWFNKCYQNTVIGAVGESIKLYVGKRSYILDALRGTNKDSVLPDNPEWFILYYYRNKDTERLSGSLRGILSKNNALSDKGHADYLSHFFSTAAKDDQKIKEELKAMQENYSGTEKEFLIGIVNEVETYHAAKPVSPAAVNLMWAEFKATGDKQIIKEIAGLLLVPEEGNNKDLIEAAERSLLINSVNDLDVRDALKEISATTSDASKSKIDNIVSLTEEFADLASAYMGRAYNDARLKKYQEAIKGDELALSLCPDYALVYNNLSNIYQDKGNPEKTLLYRKASVYVNPDFHMGYFNLGIYYFHQRDFDNAIKFDLRALEYDPKNVNYLHGVARSYQEKGDTENAVRYFQRYLEYAPNGEFAGLVRNYLASVGKPLEEDPLDPFVMLKKRRYNELERYLAALLKTKRIDENGYNVLYTVCEQLVKPKDTEYISEQVLRLLEAWRSQKPNSHFVNLCLGRFYKDYAWEARGKGFADTVTEEGARLFEERLKKASVYLEKAYALDNSDPFAPIALIVVARGLGLDKKYMEKQFQRAIKADETEYEAYLAKLIYLMPKWHGSWREMFSFARESAKSAPPNTLIPRVLAKAHWEKFFDEKDYFRQPEVWNEVKNIYLKLLENFPNSFELRNWLALTAYYAGDYGVVREQCDLIGDNWDAGDAWESFRDFERVKKEVNPLSKQVF